MKAIFLILFHFSTNRQTDIIWLKIPISRSKNVNNWPASSNQRQFFACRVEHHVVRIQSSLLKLNIFPLVPEGSVRCGHHEVALDLSEHEQFSHQHKFHHSQDSWQNNFPVHIKKIHVSNKISELFVTNMKTIDGNDVDAASKWFEISINPCISVQGRIIAAPISFAWFIYVTELIKNRRKKQE